jgi:hypothetical protein
MGMFSAALSMFSLAMSKPVVVKALGAGTL